MNSAATREIVDAFRQAWLAGETPDLSASLDSLSSTDPQARTAMLYRLVQVELESRRQRGDTVVFAEYAARFPELDASRLEELQELPTPPSSRPPLLPSRYEALNVVGRGGLGVVWRVRDRNLDRPLAVKVVRDELQTRADANRRLQQEAILTGTLQHPSVPPVVEQGKLLTGSNFFSMKLVEGRTLAELLQTERPSEAANSRQRLVRCIGILQQVAEAVAFAHSQGVVHCDLKPHNVMVGRFGEVQVMDWGMARRLGSASGSAAKAARSLAEQRENAADGGDIDQSTHERRPGNGAQEGSRVAPSWFDGQQGSERTGQLLGSPAYMAPEQAMRKTKQIAAWTDVYALSAILYEMLCGRPPVQGDSADETLRQVIEEGPKPIRQVAPNTPLDLATICEKGLERDPTRRYESAIAFQEDLERFLQGQPILARPAPPLLRVWKWVKRRPAGAALIVVTCLAIFGSIAFGVGATFYRQLEDAHRRTVAAKTRVEQERSRVASLLETSQRLRSAAEQQRTRAEAAEQLSRRLLYAADIDLAHRALTKGNVNEARVLLQTHRPEPDQEDMRGFEWHYLNRQSRTTSLEFAHKEATCLAFTPDDQYLLVGHRREPLAVYSLATGELHATLDELRGAMEICCSPDRTQIAVRTSDAVWMVAFPRLRPTRQLVLREPPSNGFRSLAFSPDGSLFGYLNSPQQVRVIDAYRGRLKARFVLPGRPRGLALETDYLWTPDEFGEIRQYNYEGEPIGEPWRTGRSFLTLAAGSQGAYVAAFGSFSPSQFAILDLRKRRIIQQFDTETLLSYNNLSPTPIVFDRSNGQVAYRDGVAVFVAGNGLSVPLAFSGNRGEVDVLALAHRAPLIASAGADGVVRVWPRRDVRFETQMLDPTWTATSLCFDAAGGKLAVRVDKGARIHIWDLESKQVVDQIVADPIALEREQAELQNSGATANSDEPTSPNGSLASAKFVYAFRFHRDGRHYVWANSNQEVRLRDFRSGAERSFAVDGRIARLTTSPRGLIAVSLLASAKTHQPSRIVVLTNEGREVRRIEVASHGRLAFSPDGARLAHADGLQTRVWNLDDDWSSIVLPTQSRSPELIFTPDGKRLIACGLDLEAWQLDPPQRIYWRRNLRQSYTTSPGLTFDPSGERLFVINAAGACLVVDPLTGRRLLNLALRNQDFACLHLSPDGLLQAGEAGPARIRLFDGRPLSDDVPSAAERANQSTPAGSVDKQAGRRERDAAEDKQANSRDRVIE